MEIHVLGPVRALRDGKQIRLGGPVDRAVLGVLAVHAGDRVSVDHLLEAAYPGVSKHSAKRALQTAVWRLRRALDEDGTLIVTDSGGYRLDIESTATDVGMLRRALAVAAQACLDGRPNDAEVALSKAAARWRGPAPELPPHVTDPIEDMVADAVEGLASLLLDAGRPDDALEHVERLLAVHPDHRSRTLADEAIARRRLPVSDSFHNGVVDAVARHRETGFDVAALAEPARTILRLVAAMGQGTLAELSAAVAAWFSPENHELAPGVRPDIAAVVDSLAEASEHGLVATSGDPVNAMAMAPSVADRMLEGLDASSVLTIHWAIARALRSVHGPAPGPHLLRWAHRLARGVPVVDPKDALDALMEAAEYAMTAGLPGNVALDLADRARGLHDSWFPADVENHSTVLLLIGRAREYAGDPAGANEVWERVADQAVANDQPALLAMAALELAGTIWRPRDHPRASDLLEEAMHRLSADDELSVPIVLRRVQMGRHARDRGWRLNASAAGDRLRLSGLSDPAARATLDLMSWAAAIESGIGTFDEDHELEALVSGIDNAPALTLMWERWGITRCIARGDLYEAERRLVDLGARLPTLTTAVATEVDRSEFALARFASVQQLAAVRRHQGREAEALALTNEASFTEDELAQARVNFDDRALKAQYLVDAGRPGDASDLLKQVIEGLRERPPGQVRFVTAMNAASVVEALAEPGVVALLTEELEPQRGRHCLVGLAGYLGVAEYALGRIRAAVGDLDAADELLAEATAANVRVGALLSANFGRLARASVLRLLGGQARTAEADELSAGVERAFHRFRAEPGEPHL